MSRLERCAVDLDAADAEPAEGSAPRRRDPSLARTIELPAICHFAGYEVLGRIAVGGMAEVFLARERGEAESSRHVALKVIRAQFASNRELAELFLQEGRVALGLGHPNLCHTLRFGTEQGHPFLAMELVHGVTLRALFARARRGGLALSEEAIVRIVANVAEALHSAHVARDARGRSLGIVHQDVSPQNVMVAYDGTVKLLDFGVASTAAERAATQALEQSATLVRGKTAYLSPEQCAGHPVDPRSDVFSLGVVLAEMLLGRRLFARASSADTVRAIACDPLPEWPASIPDSLARVLDRALAQDVTDRYATAAALQEDLESFLVDRGHVVTSRSIARELEETLGADYERAPALDASSEGVAWLRSESETLVQPIPLVRRRAPRRAPRSLTAMLSVGLALALGWLTAGWLEVSPRPLTALDTPVIAAVSHEAEHVTTTEIAPAPPTPDVTTEPVTDPTPRRHHARARRSRGAVLRDLDF